MSSRLVIGAQPVTNRVELMSKDAFAALSVKQSVLSVCVFRILDMYYMLIL